MKDCDSALLGTVLCLYGVAIILVTARVIEPTTASDTAPVITSVLAPVTISNNASASVCV